MCFDQKSSFSFAALGLFLAYYVHSRTHNTKLAIGVFWFFLMEFLQGFQYFWIDDCDNFWNQFLTLLGFVHICFQPYFTHIINSSLTKNPRVLQQYVVILRMCLLGGVMLFMRYVIAEFGIFSTGIDYDIVSDFSDYAGNTTVRAALPGFHRTQEWLRGEQLCTFSGKYHLAWSVPMSEPTYWVPSAAIHSFLMFSPFFVIKKNMVIQGVFLWLAGPYLASWITPNLMEQASIWCFFSIAQIGTMLFIIREQLLLHWGRSKDEKLSIHKDHGAKNGATNGKKDK
eukprot:TRINITY_DN12132_c0_g1_i1.p1 TRINITY_DN12132_c0_g1~~TRINITY_DN12132_c0_g1_i1.p1  ORF type:complete len:284 (+),score=49.69 TRINITY_DN12132_c0_g1_i1:55-906(+)